MKNKNIRNLAVLLTLCVLVFQACKEEEPIIKDDDNNNTITDTVRYNTHLKSFFETTCAVPYCHTTGSATGSLSSYEDAKAFVSYGRILGALNHEAGFSPMPKDLPKLNDSLIAQVKNWIDQDTLE
ncbi:MAG: hypothetical protein ACI8ZN_001288 [Bacteroidia bacterium]|jgi:hypothetical protein